MKQALRFSQLSPSRKTLIRICQTHTDGEVNLDAQLEVLLDVRLDQEVDARAELELGDFTLCAEVCRLLGQIERMPVSS